MEHAISRFMTGEHRRCDDTFSALEKMVIEKKSEGLAEAFDAFKKDFLGHFTMEEGVMFPQIEERTGMIGGPTHIMRMEHEQMRHVISQMEGDIASGNFDHFLGLSETFMILVQQHNMKEEQILYSMADQILGDVETKVVEDMKAI